MNCIILGISPGTRLIGIAVLVNGKLINYRVQTFKEKCSKKKVDKILRLIDKVCLRHRVNLIALKIPKPVRSSKGIDKVIEGILLYGKDKGISIAQCNPSKLREVVREGKWAKNKLIEVMAQKFPELTMEYQKEIIGTRPYYAKMFEAVACTYCCYM
jgi:hypothetical protein